MVVHGSKRLRDIAALNGVDDLLVLLKGGLDLSKGAKGVFAVVSGDGSQAEHFLSQVGVSRGFVDDFMKQEI